MKVQTARITLTLWTSKVLADGTSPIMLAVRYNGQALLSTHFSCLPKDWNDKDECLKRSYPNYSGINKILQDLKNQAIAAKLKFESTNTPYTAKMVIDAMKPKETQANSLKFVDVMNKLKEERHLKYTTAKMYDSVYSVFSEFIGKKDFILTEVTNDVLVNFAKATFEKSKNPNTVLAYHSKICAVLTFANNNEICDHFPKKGNEWVNKNFKKEVNHKALTEEAIANLYTKLDEMDKTKLYVRTSKVFALSFFLCGYTLFGLAPVDLAKLKIDCFEDAVVQGVDCWKVKTRRSKTNQPLTIVVSKGSFGGRTLEPFVNTAHLRDGYIFPILQNDAHQYHYDSEKKVANNLNRAENIINQSLAEIAEELGMSKFTLYALRHTFATTQIANGTNIGLIANALGRSVSGIGCYIANLTKDEDLLKISAL